MPSVLAAAAVSAALLGGAAGDTVTCSSDCLLTTFEFTRGTTECSSCVPREGKYRCPAAAGGNVYAAGMDGTYPSSGFGSWSLDQCEHDSYSPGFLAFSGPGQWEDDLVPACPKATLCACGETKDKVRDMMDYQSETLPPAQLSPLAWASSAEGFEHFTGFSEVTGASIPHFDLIYKHSDGRRQFCSGYPNIDYEDGVGELETQYNTGCSWWSECDAHYTEKSSSSEDCWFGRKDKTCSLAMTTISEGPAEASVAATTSPVWSEWGAWNDCYEESGVWKSARFRYARGGSGDLLGTKPEGESQEVTTCTDEVTTECFCWSDASCPGDYQKKSSERCECAYGWGWASWTKEGEQAVCVGVA